MFNIAKLLLANVNISQSNTQNTYRNRKYTTTSSNFIILNVTYI